MKKNSLPVSSNASLTAQKDSIFKLTNSTFELTKRIFKRQLQSDTNKLHHNNTDTSTLANNHSQLNSANSKRSLVDTTAKSIDSAFNNQKNKFIKNITGDGISRRDSLATKTFASVFDKDKILNKSGLVPNKYISSKQTKAPFFSFNGGYINYNYNYRSNLDTPFVEKNLSQHQMVSSFRLTMADRLPVIVNSYVRRTNSSLFPPITDVQVAFDAQAYRNKLAQNIRNNLLEEEKSIKDSLEKESFGLKQLQSDNFKNWLFNPGNLQKLVDAQEIVHVPKKTYDMQLPDSINKKNSDSLVTAAKSFIALYKKNTDEYNTLTKQTDSLKKVYEDMLDKYKNYKATFNQQSSNTSGFPQKDNWLLGVKNFGIGKNIVNYSELTVKNINLNGLNFEYNSWYYLAAAAGTIDYRFADFLVTPAQKIHQDLFVGRIGIGRLEKNYFILTAFHGQKQLFAGTTTGTQFSTITITGFSAQTKFQLQKNAYIVGEIAQSFSPNFLSSPPLKNSWRLSDKSSKAWSLKFYNYISQTSTKLEAQYKFTGTNYQAFNSFQTNAQLTSWYVRAEQSFLKRRLKLVADLRTNDFSNPYAIENYKANSIFKTISVSFIQKGWPAISASYMPMSQLTVVGNQVVQNQFETFSTNLSHFYTIGQQRVSTNLVFTKFYNSSSDTGFIYYNSSNLYLGHTLFFNRITGNISISYSKNSSYQYVVMDENFNFQIGKKGSAGLGVKINNLNQAETKLGEYINASLRMSKGDMIYVRIDNGYLPGSGNKLIKNTMGNISFTKTFR